MATWNCIQSEDGAAGAVLNEAPGPWQPVHTRNVVDISQSARERHAFQPIIGCSLALDRVLSDVRIVAPTSATVLIEGETGTGKELIARAIHNLSPRGGRNFVRLNCAALPAGLLESELFGYERGAFTGAATRKIGRFELANHGTLFLDEVGDIPLELQTKLLRVLQEQEFERLGSNQSTKVDVRLVTATNCDLKRMVEQKTFRSDLYYRLNVFPIILPPLRERPEDIPELVSHFVEVFSHRMGKHIAHIPGETLDALIAYGWPGNVRELQNLIERAVIRSDDGALPNPLLASEHKLPPFPTGTFINSARATILQALEATNWVVGGPFGAAARLGLKRTTLISKMKRLRIYRHDLADT